MSDLILFDSQGRVYVECFTCGNARASTENALCQKCLGKYYKNELTIECPAVKRMLNERKKR